jgi:hypothetical protein
MIRFKFTGSVLTISAASFSKQGYTPERCEFYAMLGCLQIQLCLTVHNSTVLFSGSNRERDV